MVNARKALRKQRRLFQSWRFLDERPTPATEVLLAESAAALPSLAFFMLLGLSTVIATNGLISSSAATVIGAMIIAPLMQPIGAMAYGLATTHHRLLLQATLTMISGAVFTVAIAYFATIIVGVQTVGWEIIGRTAPNALDLVVAIAAGTAAAFAATRRSVSSALPGVAIAVALVPPLCVMGIGLALGKNAIPEVGLVLHQRISVGAFLLFLANLAGIIFSGVLVFVIQGYGRWSRAFGGILVSLIVIVGLTFPLIFALEELLMRQEVRQQLFNLRLERPEFYEKIVMRRLSVDFDAEKIRVDLEAVSPRTLKYDLQKETEHIRDYLAAKTHRDVEVKATIIQADVIDTGSISQRAK
jgi:uncharacterized hydrophobic protein (TIGR00271 family)